MKKITLIASLAIALGASSVSLAQTQQERAKITKDYNLSKTAVLAQEVHSITNKNLDKALRLAKRYDWPLTVEYKDGGFGELVGVFEDDSPLYYRTYNKGGVSTIHADAVHTGGTSGLDLNGEDMIVGVWDGGLMRLTHELFEGRVIGKNATSAVDHATHVGGTIIGSAAFKNGNAIGVAPQATAHSYNWNNHYNEMIAEAEDGLLVSNHSYGIAVSDRYGNPIVPASLFGKYDGGAQTVDNIQYQLEYYLPVYAAGNDRSNHSRLNPGKGGYDLLTGEGTAKNNIVVGNIQEVEDYEQPYDVLLSTASNFGPTDDGRVKPDITAKGQNVYSAFASNDSIYGIMSGTSMAAPSVAGGIVLLQEHGNDVFGDYFRSATLRALIAHTAYKAGTEGNPNYRYGWGVMDVEEAASVISNHRDSSLVREMLLKQNEDYLMTVSASGIEDLIATIAWTDLPGSISNREDDRTPVLVNDLDLRVSEFGGDIYHPYILNPDYPTHYASTGDNNVDNIEKIEIADANGEYNVSISHKGTLEGLEDEEEEQKFSMILSGITETTLIFETFQNNAHFCESTQDTFSMELLIHTDSNLEDTVVTIENGPQDLIASIDSSNLANGVVTLDISGLSDVGLDTYTFELKAVNGTEEVNLYPSVTITQDNFEGVDLVSPANGADNIPLYTTLKWKGLSSNRVVSYTIELALDEDFTDIVDVITDITETQHTYTQLQRDKDYFWRVKAIGLCGEGEFGEVFNFHTYDLMSVEEFEQNGFVVHPNPATNKVTVNAPSTIKELKILNILGQEVMRVTPDSDQAQLDISALSAGSYLLQISDGSATEVKRLIKK